MQPRPTGVSRAGLIFFVTFFYQEKKVNKEQLNVGLRLIYLILYSLNKNPILFKMGILNSIAIISFTPQPYLPTPPLRSIKSHFEPLDRFHQLVFWPHQHWCPATLQ